MIRIVFSFFIVDTAAAVQAFEYHQHFRIGGRKEGGREGGREETVEGYLRGLGKVA